MRKYITNTRLTSSGGRIVILALALSMCCIAARLGAQERLAIEISAYRPLAAALDRLESTTGVPIHYEDIPLEHADDLELITHPRAGAQLLVARPGVISTEIDIASARIDPISAVQSVIGAHMASGGSSGEFQVSRSSNGALIVIPSQLRGASGETKTLESPLSAKITLPSEERSVIDTFAAILKMASEASGQRLDPGAIPITAGRELGQVRQIRFGVTRETAHDALTRLISELWATPVSYRLLYDPMVQYYMFNLQPVIQDDRRMRAPVDSPQEAETAPTAVNGNPFFVPVQP